MKELQPPGQRDDPCWPHSQLLLNKPLGGWGFGFWRCLRPEDSPLHWATAGWPPRTGDFQTLLATCILFHTRCGSHSLLDKDSSLTTMSHTACHLLARAFSVCKLIYLYFFRCACHTRLTRYSGTSVDGLQLRWFYLILPGRAPGSPPPPMY